MNATFIELPKLRFNVELFKNIVQGRDELTSSETISLYFKFAGNPSYKGLVKFLTSHLEELKMIDNHLARINRGDYNTRLKKILDERKQLDAAMNKQLARDEKARVLSAAIAKKNAEIDMVTAEKDAEIDRVKAENKSLRKKLAACKGKK